MPKPPITSLLPDTATLPAAGAVGRTLAALSAVGGSPAFTYTLTNSAGLSIAISGDNLVKTTANPYGTAGAKTISVQVKDARNLTKTETIAVTVT